MMLDVLTLADTVASIRDSLRGPTQVNSSNASRKFPLLTSRMEAIADLRPLAAVIRRAILPNGEIREVGRATAADMGNKKPLTMRENLGELT